ncbi:MAG: hypothetical protein DMG96_01575, partial [Acidobacteria bacterium]
MLVRIVYEFSPPRKSGQSVAAPPRFAIQDNLISPTGESSLVADKNPNQSNIRPTPSNPETVALLRVHTRLSRKETENEQKARRVPVRAQARAARAANDESHKDLTRTYKSLMAKLKRERKSIRAAELEGYALS